MARIQTYENSQGITAGSVVRYQADDAVAQSLSNIGNTVANVGLAAVAYGVKQEKEAKARAESLDNLRLQSAVLDHEDRVRQFALDQAPNYTGEGTDGIGYTKAVMDFASKDAEQAISVNFSNRPDADEVTYKFRNGTRGILSDTATTELNQGLKFQGDISNKTVGALAAKVSFNPDNYDAAASEWVSFATSTNMDRPELQSRMAKVGLAKLQRARLEAYAGQHSQEFKEAAAGVFSGEPVAGATDVEKTIVRAANDAGVDPSTMLAIGKIESGLRVDPPSNGKSTAAGVFQILDAEDTLEELGLTSAQRKDPVLAASAAATYIKRQTDVMLSKNIPVTPGKQYMTWQLGPGVALATMQSSPDTPMSDVVNRVLSNRSPEYRAKFMAANPGFYGPGVTAGQVVTNFESKVGSARTESASKITQTNPATDEAARAFFDKILPGGAPLLTAQDLAEVQLMAAKKSAELSREQQDLNLGNGIAVGAIKPDPRDEKASKALNEYVIKNNLAAGLVEGDNAAHERAAQITFNAGAAPEAFVNAYSSAINGGDVKSKMKAYAAVADLQARSPNAFDATKFSGDDRSGFSEYVALTTVSNLSPDDAVKRIDFARSPEGKKQAEAQKAGLQSSRDAEIHSLDESDVTKHFDAPWSWSKPTDSEGKFIAAATDAYKEQYVFYRQQGRSVEDAKAMALSSLDRNWGASRVADTGNGSNAQTFMPYPPEKGYSSTDVGYDWITDQAKNQAAAFVATRYPKLAGEYNTPAKATPRGTLPAEFKLKDALGVKLLSDIQTAQEARANLPRGYTLMVRLPNGQIDISQQRFFPDQVQADREARLRFKDAQIGVRDVPVIQNFKPRGNPVAVQ